VTQGVLYSTFALPGVKIYVGLFLLSLILRPVAYLLSPVGALISRRFERQADTFAYEQIGSADAMVSALKQLATQNLSNLHPDPVYAWFLYSHPPLVERVRFLNSLQRG
jgi:STE24 endopeptidase